MHPDNALTDLVEVLREQLQEKDRQIEAKDRQLSELHVLLQQTQAALPPAPEFPSVVAPVVGEVIDGSVI